MKKIITIFCFLILIAGIVGGQPETEPGVFTIARLKYGGGGDWYNNPSMIPNLLEYIRKNTLIHTAQDEAQVSLDDERLFSFPVLFMTGHGRVSFNEREADRLKLYLENGGFLYIDDDYGIDKHIRRELKKVFPDRDLVEIPFSHPIFYSHFEFTNGLPKIHEFDGGAPSAWGLFIDGRMAVFYSANTNISDGWADPDVHKDPPHIRKAALQMGTNIFIYAMTR